MEAPALSRTGDTDGARQRLRSVARRIERYAAGDADLLQALRELVQAEHDLQNREVYRERYYMAQTMARGQRDLRGPGGSR